MMTGGMFAFLFAGIWNWTYICPIVIWFGVITWFGPNTVAYVVTFGTPPMKKLPWSSMTSGFLRNLRVLGSCACRVSALAAPEMTRATAHKDRPSMRPSFWRAEGYVGPVRVSNWHRDRTGSC